MGGKRGQFSASHGQLFTACTSQGFNRLGTQKPAQHATAVEAGGAHQSRTRKSHTFGVNFQVRKPAGQSPFALPKTARAPIAALS